MENNIKKIILITVILSLAISAVTGGVMGFFAGSGLAGGLKIKEIFKFAPFDLTISKPEEKTDSAIDNQKKEISGPAAIVEYETAIINAVEKVSPAVVSIIVTKDLPVIERYYGGRSGADFFRQFFGGSFDEFLDMPQNQNQGTERREVGGGTGFIVSADGYIVTNKHVVADEDAQYTVLKNDGEKHEAKVLARDPFNDIAILKIEKSGLTFVEPGDSSGLKVGQAVIAIGNALGEFRNTVSTGVISGLSRSLVARGIGFDSEQLLGVIQTDASINRGNSGGPLLNLSGQVIGMNTAMAQGAQNIGFAIPVNDIKNIFESVKKHGRIVRPWLGIRYAQMNKALAEQNNLSVDYGALIVRGASPSELAVIPGSPAEKAGLMENDIILEINGKKIDENNLLARMIAQQKPGDEVTLKVLSKGEEKTVKAVLEEMK